MGLSFNSKIFIPGVGFTCKKCGAYCDGENFFVLGRKVFRWCDECGHLEEGIRDSHSYENNSCVNNGGLYMPENSDFLLLNPTLSKERNMPH